MSEPVTPKQPHSERTSKRSQQGRASSPRLEDVALLAGVSTATVSRALNTPSAVTPQLRESVRSAVETLGYIPHGAARALASRRSHTIGAVIPTIDNAIFARSVQALQERLFESGFTLLLASSDYDFDLELREVEALVERGIDGLLLVGDIHDPKVYQLLTLQQVPYVNLWTYSDDNNHPCVGFDNKLAAFKLTNYLLDIGHRNIAMVAGITQGNDRAQSRVNGVRQAMDERGLTFGDGHYIECVYEITEGRNAANDLLASNVRPTAIVCGNDILALGVLFECLAQKLKVPQDISITGYDGLDLAGQVEPPLTTVDIPSTGMGRRAAEYLIAQLDGTPISNKIKLEPNLMIRGTTSSPPN